VQVVVVDEAPGWSRRRGGRPGRRGRELEGEGEGEGPLLAAQAQMAAIWRPQLVGGALSNGRVALSREALASNNNNKGGGAAHWPQECVRAASVRLHSAGAVRAARRLCAADCAPQGQTVRRKGRLCAAQRGCGK